MRDTGIKDGILSAPIPIADSGWDSVPNACNLELVEYLDLQSGERILTNEHW